MIDAVRMSAHLDAPDAVAGRLDRPRVTTRDGGLVQTTGYVGPLRVSVLADTLRLRGSLPLVLRSPTTLDRAQVLAVRRRLEDHLGVDLGDAHVHGLEVSADLRLSRPVPVYLPLLQRRPRLQRVTYEGESVSFVSDVRSVVFYDRVARRDREAAAARRRGHPAPPRPPAGDVLRYEVQLKKRLRRQLGEAGPVTFAALHGRPLWDRLVGRWVREYRAVEKARVPLALGGLDARRAVALAGLLSLGRERVEAEVRAQMDDGALTRSTGQNRLAWLRALSADPALTHEDDRAAELDTLVEAAAARALAA